MLSIIIPTYNERENIPVLIRKLGELPSSHEIIVVDDNSPDGTADAVEKLDNPSVQLVRRKEKGLSGAIVAGVSAAKGENIIVMDADLSHPPELVPEFLSKLKDHDLVIGKRTKVEHWQFHRKMISKGAEFLAGLLGIKAPDPLSGFFAMRKKAFLKTRIRTKGYKILLNIIYDNPDLKIAEIPYIFKGRYKGKTKLGYPEISNYLLDLWRIRFG
jgi:dolichol-phosphate mannosyltransferase